MKISIPLAVVAAMGLCPLAANALDVNVEAGPAHVQVNTPNDRTTQNDYEARKVQTDNNRAYDQTESADTVTPKGLVRASELMNLAVYNNAEEQVGTIDDVVLDTNSGNIKYVAVSTGGFLGVGDALHAIPFKALKCEVRDGDHVAVLKINKERLQNAQGFDQDNWPNMADRTWQTTNDRQYQSQTPAPQTR